MFRRVGSLINLPILRGRMSWPLCETSTNQASLVTYARDIGRKLYRKPVEDQLDAVQETSVTNVESDIFWGPMHTCLGELTGLGQVGRSVGGKTQPLTL